MKMNDGLWVVEFGSSIGLFGRGVMVLNGQRILGGDVGYYYSGNCKVDEDRIKGEINVIRFDPNSISVFGDIENFTLSFDGTINGSDLIASATSDDFPNLEMGIKASKREDI